MKSSATHDYEKGIKRLDREAAFKIYQQIPEPGKQFPFQGWVIWEFEEASPNDVFGVSLEAFDPIRRQNKCHIVFEETCEALRVLATTRDHMDRAVRRIRNAIEGKGTIIWRCLNMILLFSFSGMHHDHHTSAFNMPSWG